MKGIYILDAKSMDKIYGPDEQKDIGRLVDIIAPPQTRESIMKNMGLLKEVEVIFSGWGAPVMGKKFLEAAPNLRAVFYGAGTIKYFTTEAFWDRNIVVTSAYAANAVPVTEYALSQILFCLKSGWHYVRATRDKHAFAKDIPTMGAYESTVGIISLGMVGSGVVEHLKHFNLSILAYDPYVTPDKAKTLGVELCALNDVFRRADVVSLHTPWLKETENMIRGYHFEMMKPYSSFINTSRGAVVCEIEMIDVLKKRPDIQAVLDVTYPEPPVSESPLYTLPNVVLTPHIAGSMDNECRRMGRHMVEELEKFAAGKPLKWQIDRKKAAILA